VSSVTRRDHLLTKHMLGTLHDGRFHFQDGMLGLGRVRTWRMQKGLRSVTRDQCSQNTCSGHCTTAVSASKTNWHRPTVQR
jgi:hypothetical protein